MATGQMNDVLRHLRKAALQGGGLSDGQLLECFITQRDEAAFEALIRRHGPMVLGVCRRVLTNPQDAEDAFQATFLVLVRKAASIRQRELVGNWLYGAAYRAALEAKGVRARRRSRERQVSAMPEPAVVEQAQVRQDLRPVLDQELSRLADKYRVPVVLCDLEGRTRKEVARQLAVPDGTLSSRLATGRRMLAKRLARRGLTLSGGAVALALSQNAASAGVPTSLVVSTVKAAATVAAGHAAAGVISAKVAALTEGVLKAMLLTKLKIATAVLLVVTMIGTGACLLTYQALASEPPQAKQDDKPQPEGATSLADAVQAFNARAANGPIGKEQPPLTEEEVSAAIRWRALDRKQLPVTDAEFRAFLTVAETRKLPLGSQLEVITHFEPNDEVTFEAWSVRLVMPRQEQKGSTYAFLIRERLIRSRQIGEEERKVIHAWQKKWRDQGGRIASDDLAAGSEYYRERQKAAEIDRSKQK